MGNCSSTSNCNPCGPDFNAINQLATKAGAYARQANTYSVDAQNAWNEFNALYLGAFAVAPTVDNEGDPLQVGALYWNTALTQLFAWSGTSWVVAANFTEFTPFLATGTITPRNLVTREADIANVKDFGAVGDGVTDDTAAFTAALAASTSIVLIPAGSYYIPSPSSIAGNTSKLWLSSNAFFRTTVLGALLPFTSVFYGEIMPRDFGPIAVANDNIPQSAGQNAGLKVITGKFPTATPGLNDRVAATFGVNNIDKTTSGVGIWGINCFALQNATNSDGSPATDSMTRAAEFEVNKVVGGAQADPWFGGTPCRSNGIEIIGHGGGVFQNTSAIMTWANDTTGAKWWQIGAAISRTTKWGILFKQNPAGASDTGIFLGGGATNGACLRVEGNATNIISSTGNHVNIIDLSANTGGIGTFVRMPTNATSTASFRNFANFNNRIDISSGDTTSQQSSLFFSHAGTNKWQIGKLSDDRFSIYGVTNAVTPIVINETGEVGINVSAINASATFQIDSTTKGFLPPRMTGAQRDLIASPTAGLVIYNTTTNLLNFYNGSVWGAV